MSHIFEEFFPEGLPNLSVAQFENDSQRLLRERFDSLVDKNQIDKLMFDPSEWRSFRPIMFESGEEEAEKQERQVAQLLQHNMLRQAGLYPPASNDPLFIAERQYKDGSRSVVFDVTRKDTPSVPVYFQSNSTGVVPQSMYFISRDMARETAEFYQQLEVRGNRLRRRVKMSQGALSVLSMDRLEEFISTYDDIQKL